MAERRWFGHSSRNVLILVVLVMTTSGLTVPHWHTKWNGPGCELCHIRYSPNLQSPIEDSPAVTVVTERDWQSDDQASELDTCILTRSSRAPPASTPFTAQQSKFYQART